MITFCSKSIHHVISNSRLFSKKIDSDYQAKSVSSYVLEKMHADNGLSPIEKGYKYLEDGCGAKRCFQPYISANPSFKHRTMTPFPEIFDTALILDLLYEKPLDPIITNACLIYLKNNQRSNHLFSFFEDPTLLPQDVDDTALVALNLIRHRQISHQVAEKIGDAILLNTAENGIIQTYFPPRGGREGKIDPSVCANALRLLHCLGKGDGSFPTENYLYDLLEKMNPADSAEGLYYGKYAFFYFMWEAIKQSNSLKKRFESLFIDRVVASIGASSSPIDLATRVTVLIELGLNNDMEIDKLYRLQQKDGSWPIDIAYTGSRKNLYWGSKMVSTAFAIRALDHKKCSELKDKLRKLPVFTIGIEIVNGSLKYKESFSPLLVKHSIVVVTHTETPSVLNARFYDADKESPNNALTEKGKQDAITLAKKLESFVLNRSLTILHGDNIRALQTAQSIQRYFDLSAVRCVSWLNEINCLDWSGRGIAEVLETNFAAQAMFLKSDCLVKASKGQNFLEILNIVYEGLIHLQQTEREGKTIILSTSRVTLVAIKILLGKDIIYCSNRKIDWSAMAKQTKNGTIFPLFH